MGGDMAGIELPLTIEARNCLAKRKCVPGGDGARPQWMAGVSDDAWGMSTRSMQAFLGDFSVHPQTIGWPMSRASFDEG